MKRTVWIEGDRRVRWYRPDPQPGESDKDGVVCKTPREAKLLAAEKRLWLENWKPGAVDTSVAPLVVLGKHLLAMAGSDRRKQSLITRRVEIEDFIKRQTVVTMAAFTSEAVAKWVEGMRERKNSPKTIRHRLIELRAFKNFAMKNKYLSADPFQGIIIPPDPRQKGRRFTLQEQKDLIRFAPDWFRPYVIVGLNCGPRRGDLLQMEWSDIDTERWVWIIPPFKAKVPVGRRLPILEPVKAALLSILGGKNPAEATGLVFPWKPGKVYRGWYATKKAAGITLQPHKAKPHHMRHTWATELGRRVSWPTLKALGGWKSDEMAAHYSGNATDEELREDMERFGVNLGYDGVKDGKSGQ